MSIQTTHIEFIQARLPAWLKRASRAEQKRFKVLVQQLQRDSDALNALLVDLPAPETFASELLQAEPQIQAWRPINGVGDNADAIRRARVRRGPYVIDPTLSVIKAAMGNYPPGDAVIGGEFDTKGELFIQGRPQEFTQWGAPSDTAPLPMSPAEFARLCRRVDVGGAYRQLLEGTLPRIGSEIPAIANAYMAYARSQLTHDAYEAKLDGRLDETGARLLAHVGIQLEERPVVPLACEVKSLELLSVPLFGARVYWGVQGDASGVRPIVLHIPNDEVAPLKQFASLQAMSAELTERVRRRRYRERLMEYFPLRLQALLGTALHDQVEWRVDDNPNVIQELYARITGWRDGERGEDGNRHRIRIPMPKVAWGMGDLRIEPWTACYNEWRGQALDNAAALMVPTRYLDWQAQLARLAYWENLVEQALMVAATIFPFCAPIGMTAAAVGGVRLVYEIFEGIQAFNQGQAQEGIEHIFNVLFGIAQGAYLGFIGGAIEPMQVHDGSTRLWNGDVTPFQARRLPPVEAQQDAWGVWRTTDKAWVRIDDRYFEVQGTGDALDLSLPVGHRGVRPPLAWSRARGWQWAHRDPMQWGNLDLLRSFAETPGELDDVTILALQRQVGISEAHLRYLQAEGQPLPAIFADALDEARNWQWLRHTIERLRRDEAPGGKHFRIVQTLVDLPGWPKKLSLRYYDEVTLYPVGNKANTRFIRLSKADLEHDAWASYVLANLGTDEQTAILGQSSFGLRPAERSRLLAQRWAELLERNAARVTKGMRRSSVLDPLSAPVRRAFPGLPESIANELARETTGQDRLRLLDGRVTQGLGQRCAEALRELRLSRALHALERGESSGDRDRIVMGLLGRSPQAQGRLHLRLWSRELRGPIEVEAEGPIKVIRQEDDKYRPFDEYGEELAGPLALEEALLRAMPDDARQALGLNIWEADTLRAQLFAQAMDDRQGLRSFLSMKGIGNDGARPQWLNGRLGYPLSGRGRLALQEWRGGLDHRLEQLYPNHAGIALARLRLTLAEQARREGIGLEDLLGGLEAQWTALDEGLHQWAVHDEAHHSVENLYDTEARARQRNAVAEEIRRAWRRATDPHREGGEISLQLVGHDIGRLPPINANFDHIEELTLVDLSLDEDPSDFLRLFPNLDTLRLHDNHLKAIPVAVGELRGLMELSLGHNPLAITADVFAPLLGADSATHLRAMNLSGISSDAAPSTSAAMIAAINRLAELPSLREVVWNDNLHFTPQELAALTALPGLHSLDLVNCGLRLDEAGSAFLRTATSLKGLRLSGNNCTYLPNLPELTQLRELELANAGLDKVPVLALAVLANPSEHAFLDLKGNRINDIQDELLPALGARPKPDDLVLLLHDNPLPSAQIQGLRVFKPEAFRYTVDAWLDSFPSFQRSLEAARDDAGNRRFIDWFSTAMTEANSRADIGLAYNDRVRAGAVLQHYTGFRTVYAELSPRLADFDQQLGALRGRLQARILDREQPDIAELEVHFMMFTAVQRARLEPQSVPFAGFLNEHYDYWNLILTALYPDAVQRNGLMTQERFIDWLCDAQDSFNNNDQASRVGEMTWRPYLGLMSLDWTDGLAIWDTVENDLVDAFSEPVDPSGWPQVLLDNLVHPDADLPSALEHVSVNGQMVWRRSSLEPMADVDWAAGQPVNLNDDQFRRTMAIYRSVKSREVDALVRRITTDLVVPWWPVRAPRSTT
ncbi:dermonecrotic toxin domain-containing protein [Pseudomonas sp. Z4-20]|uniref:dermonecrotic toxin domain-containing protein n=1 Tax=Pseudomonas sp. Z4-20 TaxID=2817414 RepID=UPI003DA82D35